MFAKAMKSSAILSVILLFVTIDCFSRDDQKAKMCDIFKPNGTFKGIKVYRTLKGKLHMYGKGNEWEFFATNKSIVLLPETIKTIVPTFKSLQWKPDYSKGVSLRLDIMRNDVWDFECFV